LPSLVSHGVVGLAAGVAISAHHPQSSLVFLCVIASVFPDIDGISFALGIPYGSLFGHRGFLHSIFFAFILSAFIVHFGFSNIRIFSYSWFFWQAIFFSISLSHVILDGMTEGGMGVAYFSPFSKKRYLLPWKPIIACPLRIEDFFSEWGKITAKTEFLWVWIPSFILIFISLWLKG